MLTSDQKNESMDADSQFDSAVARAIFPKIRGKVLALFLLNPEKRFYFREAVRIIGDSPASIQRELKSLTAAGILRMEPIGIQKFYSANTKGMVYGELKSIVRKTFGVLGALKEVLGLHLDKIQFAWIDTSGDSDGRAADGDINLSLIGTLWVGDLAAILEPVEESLGRSIAPSLYTKDDFAKKCKLEPDFHRAITRSNRIFVIGDSEKLAESILS